MRFYLTIGIFLFLGCSSNDRQAAVYLQAESFFQTFAERQDWDRLCSFYREDLEFQDVTLQLDLDSLWQFKRFYNWPDTAFKKLNPAQEHLIIESLVANDSMAVARGHLQPFYYYGQLIDIPWGMEFTIWLYFDEDLKIIRQIDWMEYDPTVLESVVKRVKEHGHERTPDWLDLSR